MVFDVVFVGAASTDALNWSRGKGLVYISGEVAGVLYSRCDLPVIVGRYKFLTHLYSIWLNKMLE